MPEWQKLAAGWKEGGAGCNRAVAIRTQHSLYVLNGSTGLTMELSENACLVPQ